MLYSRSAEYAIRALVYLACLPEGKFAMTRTIAEQEDIPVHFLAKILQELTRKGMLRSNKGPSGGFTLQTPAHQIRLLEVVEALDGKVLAQSADRIPWSLDSWNALHSRIMDTLGQSTVAGVAEALLKKREAARRNRKIKRPTK